MSTTIVRPEPVSGPSGKTIGMAVLGLVAAVAIGFGIANLSDTEPVALSGGQGTVDPTPAFNEFIAEQQVTNVATNPATEIADEREAALEGAFARIEADKGLYLERAGENTAEREAQMAAVLAGVAETKALYLERASENANEREAQLRVEQLPQLSPGDAGIR